MRLIKKYLPDQEKLRRHRILNWLGPVVHAPDLWHFNRRSVAGGVAVGAFFAFVIPIGQFLAAAVVALILRVNLPVALTSTLISNPFTYAPWYYLAYRIGAALLGVPVTAAASPGGNPGGWGGLAEGFSTVLAMAPPLLVGLLILAVLFALGGYVLVHLLWRLPAYLRLLRLQALARRRSS